MIKAFCVKFSLSLSSFPHSLNCYLVSWEENSLFSFHERERHKKRTLQVLFWNKKTLNESFLGLTRQVAAVEERLVRRIDRAYNLRPTELFQWKYWKKLMRIKAFCGIWKQRKNVFLENSYKRREKTLRDRKIPRALFMSFYDAWLLNKVYFSTRPEWLTAKFSMKTFKSSAVEEI